MSTPKHGPWDEWPALIAFALCCAALGAVLTFALISGLPAEVFASTLVAAGTFVLAFFTWQSVVRTSDVIAGEDRRHQQGLAPLLIVEAAATQWPVDGGAETGIRVCNIGYGLALNVRITLEGTLHYIAFSRHEDTEENKEHFAGKFDPAARSIDDGKDYLNVREREADAFNSQISVSALEAGGSYFQHEQDFFDRVYSNPTVLYRVAVARYEDMFGNAYATRYLDEQLDRYDWEQPKHLRLPRPESR